jgi:hypothetical protein
LSKQPGSHETFFRQNVESQASLVPFCVTISDQVETQTGLMMSDVQPVLAYMVSSYFPATVVPDAVMNLLKSVTFQSKKKQSFHQVRFY